MKLLYKILIGIVAAVVLIVILGVGYLYLFFPKVDPAPDMVIERTPERIERGKYLANHVSVCMDCHSERDWSKFAAPLLPGTEGKGGELFDEAVGFPGSFPAKNITPYHLGDWTDGEIYRAITAGVDKEGNPLFPSMPYTEYAKMDSDDIKSIIAYLRTLHPIENDVPESEANFPMNLIMRTIPETKPPVKAPANSDTVKYGEYLTIISGCQFCHSPVEKGQLIPGREYSGGQEFLFRDGSMVRSLNITPDKSTGIGNWSREMFIQRFRAYSKFDSANTIVEPGDFNTVMPWTFYSGMTEEDLNAIYKYLMTLKPISNRVERFVSAKK